MQEIGTKLKDKREEQGVTIEEAAEDLKIRPSQIMSIEEGDITNFKDVFYLKYFIRDYAKYLGLDYEKIVDEFNEFLFDYTSKIPVEEIEKAKKTKKKVTKKIISPYTMTQKKKIEIPSYLIYITIGLIIIAVSYVLLSNYQGDDFVEKDSQVETR
ncbi:MAG: helix-turn-helix domain-containing protein [bacterium]|nr:helix-turn-helix domain-containing protein [bacterium]